MPSNERVDDMATFLVSLSVSIGFFILSHIIDFLVSYIHASRFNRRIRVLVICSLAYRYVENEGKICLATSTACRGLKCWNCCLPKITRPGPGGACFLEIAGQVVLVSQRSLVWELACLLEACLQEVDARAEGLLEVARPLAGRGARPAGEPEGAIGGRIATGWLACVAWRTDGFKFQIACVCGRAAWVMWFPWRGTCVYSCNITEGYD
ncbi:unnamed protein product [Urochloa humidicola]